MPLAACENPPECAHVLSGCRCRYFRPPSPLRIGHASFRPPLAASISRSTSRPVRCLRSLSSAPAFLVLRPFIILSRENTLERGVEFNLRGKQVTKLSMIGGLLLSMCTAPAFGQIEMAQKVMPGPHGRPLLISNEWDQLVEPLSVFSNDNLEIFSPDFTTDDWILKNVGGFYDGKKQYAMLLTVFYKNDSNCRRTRIPDGHSNDADFLTSCVSRTS